jgi:hypothetical protein
MSAHVHQKQFLDHVRENTPDRGAANAILGPFQKPSRKAFEPSGPEAHDEEDELSKFPASNEEHGLVDRTSKIDDDELAVILDEEEDDELRRLPDIRNENNTIDLQLSSSTPTRGVFFGKDSYQGNTEAFRIALSKHDLGSAQSYVTAKSSLASYRTAPLSISIRGSLLGTSRDSQNKMHLEHMSPSGDNAWSLLIDDIAEELSDFVKDDQTTSTGNFISCITGRIKNYTSTNSIELSSPFEEIAQDLLNYARSVDTFREDALERNTVAAILRQINTLPRAAAAQVFTSEWIEYLGSRGLILSPAEELDWSGRGQHVEYAPAEETQIPLKAEKVIGHSNTALVESVMCRRIRLARKTIRCTRRLSHKDAIIEVEHLQRLQHAHIVRVVGTYTLRKNLAILLYPAADWNLEEFMEMATEDPYRSMAFDQFSRSNSTLASFFGCLSNAVHFIHIHNVKHMDIKPKNLLVRKTPNESWMYRIYIADFGIARSYLSAAEAETDSPTSYTPTYAAPEVVQQNKRGFKADIFSLGCVFMEILATLISIPTTNALLELRNLRLNSSGDTSYQANIEPVLAWLNGVTEIETKRWQSTTWAIPEFLHQLRLTIQASPNSRPSASILALSTDQNSCNKCHLGPEPFEAAGPRFTS